MLEIPSTPLQGAAFARRKSALSSPNFQVSLSLGESANDEKNRAAWAAVVARHGILRSAFQEPEPGRLVLRVSEKAEPVWISLDWQQEPPEQIPAKWSAFLEADAVDPFDPAAASLARFHEIRLPGGGRHYLVTFPAWLVDEASVARLLIDWLTALGGEGLSEAGESIPAQISPAAAWKEILAGAEAPLALRFRAAVDQPGEAALTLSRDETTAFKDLCRDKGLDPAATLHSLWSLVLRRFGAEGNVSTALVQVAAGGGEAGLCETWVPVVHTWHGSVAEWLKDATQRAETAAANIWIDPDLALAAAGCAFGTSATAASFAWKGEELNDVIHSALPRWINCDARLHRSHPPGCFLEVRNGFRYALRAGGPGLSKAVAESLLGRFETLLRELPEFLEKPVRHVPVLNPEEIRALRAASRGPEAADRPSSLVAAFQSAVAAHGGRTAVEDGDYAMSYSELDALSDKLAAHFAHAGLAGGWNVGLFLSQSSWIPIALLGSLKAGNAIVPLDPSAPPEWIEKTLAAHDAGVVLCDAASAPLLDTSTRRRVVLDQEWDGLEVAEMPRPELGSDSPAVVLPGFCDGDGPSLKALTHGMLTAALLAGAKVSRFGEGDIFLAHSAAGGGAFIDEWLIPLLQGGTVRVADDELLDPATAKVTHVRLSAPEWANQAARMLRDVSPLADTLRVVVVECGTPNIKVLDVWHGRLPGGSVLFFSPAGLCGLGLSGPASPTAPLLAAGKPSEEIEAFVCDGDGHDLAPLFAGDLFLRFPGWKKVSGGTSRRGLATGLLAWREENGCLHVESAAAKAPGVAAFEASRRILKSLPDVLDACSEDLLWTLAGGKGLLRVEEWPLNRGGWIDVPALPRPEVAKAPKVAEPVKAHAAPRVAAVAAAVAWTPVVVLQESGPGSRLVLIHGASGDVDLYRPLAEAIGATRRVIAIRSRGAADSDACHPSIESAAAAYLGAVFEDDPSGRFVLAGYGYGTAVALEMARQLKAAGRKVPKLLLIGAPAPAAESKGGWASLVKSAMSRFSASQPIEPGDLSTGASAVHEAAWRRYRFVPADIAADVVLPSDFPPEAIDAWQDLLPDAAIEPVTCVWSEMLTFPSVKRLASLLDERH